MFLKSANTIVLDIMKFYWFFFTKYNGNIRNDIEAHFQFYRVVGVIR